MFKALHKGESSHSEPTEISCIDGTTVTVVVSASPLHGVDKRLVGAVVLIQDITEPKKIVPVVEKVESPGSSFTRTFAPYSITVLELKTR